MRARPSERVRGSFGAVCAAPRHGDDGAIGAIGYGAIGSAMDFRQALYSLLDSMMTKM